LEYVVSSFEPCVLINLQDQIFIAIDVNTVILFSPSGSARSALKIALKSEFQLIELGTLNWLIGIQIEYHSHSVTLSQRAYIDKLLSRFGMTSCNPVTLPLDPNSKLRKCQDGDNIADATLYQQIIGFLLYLVIGTRPDLAFTMSLLSRYSSQPTTIHMGATKRVLPYIKGTRDKFLTYTKCSVLSLAGFADADFANDKNDRKSISGQIFQLAINTISWSLQKQKCVSTSTVEAEYISISLAAKD